MTEEEIAAEALRLAEEADQAEAGSENEGGGEGEEESGDDEGGTGGGDGDEGEEGVVVTIGDEDPEVDEHASAPAWVKELRQKNREDRKELKELRAKLAAKEAPEKVALGKKPTLDGFDYDAEKFEAELSAWYERKRDADAEAAQAEKAQEEQAKAWNAKLEEYAEKKAALKAADYDDAEGAIQEMFDVTQQGIVLQGADNPALVTLALGRNSKKAKELAGIKDPIKFAFAIAKLETQLKVSGKKAPPPEKVIKGNASSSGAVDSTLERLRADAAKTGDYSKVGAYKRKKRQA